MSKQKRGLVSATYVLQQGTSGYLLLLQLWGETDHSVTRSLAGESAYISEALRLEP